MAAWIFSSPTPVVEVGIDVPNATVMVIEGADRFGLAQLHQFRGRVGRGEHASYCVLVAELPSEDAKERLAAMEEMDDGFELAEKDLELRGPGDYFGTRQSGLPDLRMAASVTPTYCRWPARKRRPCLTATPPFPTSRIEAIPGSIDVCRWRRSRVGGRVFCCTIPSDSIAYRSSLMPNNVKTQFLQTMEQRFGRLQKLPRTQSLYDLGEGRARIYVRYSRIHERGEAFYGLRQEDLRLLDGRNSVICFLWEDQEEPLSIPYEDYQELFGSTQPANDGQYKVMLFFRNDQIELYVAKVGRFSVNAHTGWERLTEQIDKLEEMFPQIYPILRYKVY